MAEINIEVNIEEGKWNEEVPDAEEVIKKACIEAVRATQIDKHASNIEISILLTNDKSIRKLNSGYRDKDKPTNVLSFPQEEFTAGNYEEVAGEIALGDIIFALETIQNEAIEQNKPLANHLTHLAIHGTLHLLGYDHEDEEEAEIMEALEIKILASIGIDSPY